MTVRPAYGSVGPVRKRAVLAASLALTPAPVANAYGHSHAARTKAAKQHAAMTASAQASVNAEKARDTYIVPAPPVINFVYGRAPGLPPEALSPAATDPATGTVYYTQPLDKFARAHEVGHVFDSQVLTDGDRRYFQRTLHARPGEWRPADSAADNPGAQETFADYYAAAATRLDLAKQGVASYTQFGPKRLKRFEQALARIAARRNLQPYQP